MYGFEALWFNVKDGYLGKKTSSSPSLGLGRQAHPSSALTIINHHGKSHILTGLSKTVQTFRNFMRVLQMLSSEGTGLAC